jgi:hypothetical protein
MLRSNSRAGTRWSTFTSPFNRSQQGGNGNSHQNNRHDLEEVSLIVVWLTGNVLQNPDIVSRLLSRTVIA